MNLFIMGVERANKEKKLYDTRLNIRAIQALYYYSILSTKPPGLTAYMMHPGLLCDALTPPPELRKATSWCFSPV